MPSGSRLSSCAAPLRVCGPQTLEHECLGDLVGHTVHRTGGVDHGDDRATLGPRANARGVGHRLALDERSHDLGALHPVGEERTLRAPRVPHQAQLGMAERHCLSWKHPRELAAALDAPRLAGHHRRPRVAQLLFEPPYRTEHSLGDHDVVRPVVESAERADDVADLWELLEELAQPDEVDPPGVAQDANREIPAPPEHLAEVVEHLGELRPGAGSFLPTGDEKPVGYPRARRDIRFCLNT